MGVQRRFECPVFHPTLKDVSGSFEAYLERLEKRYARVGVCKIVAPKGLIGRSCLLHLRACNSSTTGWFSDC